MNMDDSERTDDGGEVSSLLTIAVGTVLTVALPDLVSIPKHEAFLVGWTIASVVAYFIPPRPEMGFVRWMLERLIFLTCFYLACFKIPLLLKSSLTTPLAYGIPITIFVVGFVAWLRHLKSSSQRPA
jgi:hypothetical protein